MHFNKVHTLLAKVCGTPADGVNTVPVPAKNFTFLEVHEYKCNPGYVTTDQVAAVCLQNKKFSIPPPNCTVDSKYKRTLL